MTKLKYLIKGNDIQYKIKPFNLDKEKEVYNKIKSLFQENQLNGKILTLNQYLYVGCQDLAQLCVNKYFVLTQR